MKGIADTGFLVAFANRNDAHHLWALQLAEQITDPLLTCEAVLAETAFHLNDSEMVFNMLEDGLIKLSFRVEDEARFLAPLARRYRVRNPDLADLCLIRMSELFPGYPVITVDRADFQVYRRNKRERIPLILPPL